MPLSAPGISTSEAGRGAEASLRSAPLAGSPQDFTRHQGGRPSDWPVLILSHVLSPLLVSASESPGHPPASESHQDSAQNRGRSCDVLQGRVQSWAAEAQVQGRF